MNKLLLIITFAIASFYIGQAMAGSDCPRNQSRYVKTSTAEAKPKPFQAGPQKILSKGVREA